MIRQVVFGSTRLVTDVGLLVLRLTVAVVFIAHGRGDIFEAGVGNNITNYRDAGIPLAALSAPFAAYLQFVGGILFALGLMVRPIGAGFVVVMTGALLFVHRGETLVPAPDGSGYGFALMMGAASLALVLTGPGRFSLEQLNAQARPALLGGTSQRSKGDRQPVSGWD